MAFAKGPPPQLQEQNPQYVRHSHSYLVRAANGEAIPTRTRVDVPQKPKVDNEEPTVCGPGSFVNVPLDTEPAAVVSHSSRPRVSLVLNKGRGTMNTTV